MDLDWEKYVAIAEICGAVAVIVTLIYLAIQIRQSTIATRGATINAVTDRIFQEQRWAAELADTFSKFVDDPESLSRSEKTRYLNWVNSGLRNRQNEYFLYKQGSLDEQIWRASVAMIPYFLSEPMAQNWWNNQNSLFASEFRDFVNSVVEQSSDE